MIRVRLGHCSRNGGVHLCFAEKEGAGALPAAKTGLHIETRAHAIRLVQNLEQQLADIARQIIIAKILAADPNLNSPASHEGMVVTVDLTAANVVVVS